MAKFNTTTVMLLDEDIQLKKKNATNLMYEDIEYVLMASKDNFIELEDPSYLDGYMSDDVCEGIELTEDGIIIHCEYGDRNIGELDYEQLHTVYEAIKSEGYFNEVED